MKKLCIVISSDYTKARDLKINSRQPEIEKDYKTIEETMSDTHDLRQYKVPFQAGQMFINGIVQDILAASISSIYSECHIVINSHGSSAIIDSPISLILKLIEEISLPITQISALVCNAMAQETLEDRKTTLLATGRATALNAIAEGRSNISLKNSTGEKLKLKLESLNSRIVHSFNIIGPIEGYSGFENSALVKNILLGEIPCEGIRSIEVDVKPKELFDVEEIHKAVGLMKATKKQAIKEINDEYIKATNLLGDLSSSIFDKLKDALEQKLSEEDLPLDAKYLFDCLKGEDESFPLKDLHPRYSKWKKDNKMTSDERIELFDRHLKSLPNRQLSLQGMFKQIPEEAKPIISTLIQNP